jgi:hypothetical protein
MATETATPPAPPPSAEAPAPSAAEPATLEQPPAASPAKANGAKKPAKGEKAKGSKGDKKADKKAAKGAEPAGDGPNVAAHPRAARGIARAKSWGGLIGFALGGYLALPTNTLAGAAMRALIAGVVCYVAVWAGAVFVWRRLVMLEIKGREQELITAMQAARARNEPPAPSGERLAAAKASS